MTHKQTILILLITITLAACGTSKKEITTQGNSTANTDTLVIKPDSVNIYGVLTMPANATKPPLVIIIAGSGPTDMNGNQPRMKSGIYKILSDSLVKHSIATFRYDKRAIGLSKYPGFDESKLTFDTYVNDAAYIANYLKQTDKFSQIIIAGHSEGSLIGMIAAQKAPVDKFISLEGAGRPIDVILKEQLATQPEFIKKDAYPIIDSLKQGKTVNDIPKILYALFRPSVQPYLISWMKYDPAKEIAKLKIPVLIIQGTTDIQVSTEDAKILKQAYPQAKLVIVEGMNHILRQAPKDKNQNIKTYLRDDLPLMQQPVEAIVKFVFQNQGK